MATLELQPDGDAGKDNYIDEGHPTFMNGSNPSLGLNDSPRYSALLQFDLSSIPATATITAVTLQVTVYNTGGGLRPFRILPANDWVESESSWNERKSGSSWTGSAGCSTAGTDYDSTKMGPDIDASGLGDKTTEFDENGIADVQGWVDGTYTNNGLILIHQGGSGVWLRSSDYTTTAAERPKLTVQYTLPADAASQGAPLLRRMRH